MTRQSQDTALLYPELLRELHLADGGHPQLRPWVSAASGLVRAGRHLHVVADDEHHLCSFVFDGDQPRKSTPLQLLTLLPDPLPLAHELRKRAKADLEVLLQVPASERAPYGSLVCIGSGGKPNRRRALTVPLLADGAVQLQAIAVHDMSALFNQLAPHFGDLNIEGACICGETLLLLQRGNKGKQAASACIQFALGEFTGWLDGSSAAVPTLQAITLLDFGQVQGVPLCPTDAAALPGGGWVATLVAEDTNSSIADGACVASAIAVMNAGHSPVAMYRLHGSPKVEGVALLSDAVNTGSPALELLLVTDADDPQQPSKLLRVTLPWRAVPRSAG